MDKELRDSILTRGIAAIRIPGLDGKPHHIDSRDAEIVLDFVNRECWYRLDPQLFPLMHAGWIMVPFENIFAIAYNIPKHETSHGHVSHPPLHSGL